MNEELTAKEVLQITWEICASSNCKECPFDAIMEKSELCRYGIAKHADEVVEICKKWKSDHTEIKTEWVHVCRIIEDKGYSKRCVYEEEIDEYEILPFDTYDKIAEDTLKEYMKNHEGNFFVTVERLCRRVVG